MQEIHSALQSLNKRMTRAAVLGPLFFLSKDRKIRLARWLRGREQCQKLSKADCVIVSYGKSGRTWLRVMLSRVYQIKYGLARRHLIGFDNFYRMNRAIPKIFFTHDNYVKDYSGNVANKKDYYDKNVILLVRNPADVAVSQYFQWKHRMRAEKKELNKYPSHGADISMIDFVMDEDAGLPKVVEFMNLWADEMDKLKSALIVRYEDLRAETETVLSKVLDFMGTPTPSDEVKEAVTYASVENMRQLEAKRVFWFAGGRMRAKDRNDPNSFKVRRAKVGGYRDYFEADEIARIERYIREHLSPKYGYAEAALPPRTATA
ncbi:MAG: sulfotransferase domain-containing protein [Hyphomicrobiales bacterium]|nr:sulfotransferase domain-containing protein [Hyphomicrobiales bacterium]